RRQVLLARYAFSVSAAPLPSKSPGFEVTLVAPGGIGTRLHAPVVVDVAAEGEVVGGVLVAGASVVAGDGVVDDEEVVGAEDLVDEPHAASTRSGATRTVCRLIPVQTPAVDGPIHSGGRTSDRSACGDPATSSWPPLWQWSSCGSA